MLLAPLMSIHYAHLVMLTECHIVSRDDARVLRAALDGISVDAVVKVPFDGTYEDLFFYLEHLIAVVGRRAGGRAPAHGAQPQRHRDDDLSHVAARQHRRAGAGDADAAPRAARAGGAAHAHDLRRAHPHPAGTGDDRRPLSARRHRAARTRRQAARSRVSLDQQNPLGACAITGTGFPIDRQRTSDLLGFDAPTGNTYGSIATVDYALEGASATAVTIVGLGRVVQDLLLWGTMEFGYLRLADGFVQSSSIMPQKRNPVALEHARGIGSQAVGQAQAIITARAQHAVRRHQRHRRRPAAAHRLDVPRRAAHGVDRGGGAQGRASSTSSGWKRWPARAAPPSPNWPTRWRAITACRSAPPTRSPGG